MLSKWKEMRPIFFHFMGRRWFLYLFDNWRYFGIESGLCKIPKKSRRSRNVKRFVKHLMSQFSLAWFFHSSAAVCHNALGWAKEASFSLVRVAAERKEDFSSGRHKDVRYFKMKCILCICAPKKSPPATTPLLHCNSRQPSRKILHESSYWIEMSTQNKCSNYFVTKKN